ncbi:MAG: hypothetical protein ABSE90_07160 [Verrucomicrobiota bacterium]|jgi:hypothetical protein
MKPIETVNELKGRFRAVAKDPDGLFLLSPEDTLRFIESGDENGLRLVGIEGFVITAGGAFQPCQEHSNDFADAGMTTVSFVKETKRFIEERKSKPLWFEVVFETI